MTAFLVFLLVQVTLQWVVIGLLGYRIVHGRFPQKAKPVLAEPLARVPEVAEAVPSVLERLNANPPTADWHQRTPKQREAFAREIAEKGRQLLGR